MEMHIDLLDGYWIGADKLNYILKRDYISGERTRNGKKVGGKSKTVELSYHRTITDVLEKFIKVYSKEKTADFEGDLKEYSKILAETQKEAVSSLLQAWGALEKDEEQLKSIVYTEWDCNEDEDEEDDECLVD